MKEHVFMTSHPKFSVQPAQESADRMMQDLSKKGFEEQKITNWAVPFSDKQNLYRSSYERALFSLNFSYILEARGG